MARRESVFDMVSGMVAKDLEPLKRHLIKKARREWAERKAKAGVQFISVLTDGEVHGLVAKLLQAEHARAVRIVKRLAVKAEQASKKQRVQDFRDNGSPAKKYTDADLLDSAALLMRSLLVSLQKGRA